MRGLVVLCVRVIAILVVGEVAVLAGTRSAYRDPFAPYQAIMPGQPWEALKDYPCHLQVTERTDGEPGYCKFTPKAGTFSLVTVEYSQVIKRIGFSVRRDSLYLGDLIHCWGRPTSIGPNVAAYASAFLNVYWGKQVYAVIDVGRYGARLSYVQPISYVSIEREQVSCRSH